VLVHRLVIICSLFALALGCDDPVRARAIAALGPEAPGVRPGPLHRPGQPCLLCHDPSGDRDPAFSVAGTVYRESDERQPLNVVTVHLVDADGRAFSAPTNCAGNFFVSPDEYTPRYPLWTTLQAEDQTIDMESPIYRDGSCASCHTDPKSPTSAGHVFLLDQPADLAARHLCR
jgi:hypothetical protein